MEQYTVGMNDKTPSADDLIIVTIDRVSGGKNLVARSDPDKHILPEDVCGRIPAPGEKWRVKKAIHRAHPIALEPQEYIKTIDDYTPLYDSSFESPKKKSGKIKLIDSDLENSDYASKKAKILRKKHSPAGTKINSFTPNQNFPYTSRKNYLLNKTK